MRAFLAIEIPKDISPHYSSLINIKTEIAKISSVKKSKMHITLVFFDNLENKNIDKIKDILQNIKINLFDIVYYIVVILEIIHYTITRILMEEL